MRLLPLLAAVPLLAATLPKDDGYRGIWYYNQPTKNQYRYKYSGGFATYPQQHAPIAIYSRAANKTFFVYGGTLKETRELLHMVSYYDHKTGMVPRPTILLNKQTQDAHDNPTLSIDDQGYLWVFSSAHGVERPSYIHKSVKPYSIGEFEQIEKTNFSYTQPWHIAGEGFLFLHTLYRDKGRTLFWKTSRDGSEWTEPRMLSRFDLGHYQISWPNGKSVGTAFNYHPAPVGLNARTNLYYMETPDMGAHWRTAGGRAVETPLNSAKNAALVRDYEAEGLKVYLKDVNYDGGRPAVLHLTTKGWEPGPEQGARVLTIAVWSGKDWEFRRVGETDHAYDYGSLYIEPDGVWRVVATSAPGPQPWSTGGEVVMFTSRDRGRTWFDRQLTRASKLNHNYPRRPLNAQPDFYALWADGHALEPSESALYFCNRDGAVFKLPPVMRKESEKPVRVK